MDLLNTIENYIKITTKNEADRTLPFLDTYWFDEINTAISPHQSTEKPTNSNRYPNFRSDRPPAHKQSVVRSLSDQARALCSTKKKRQNEIKHVKDASKLNSYPNTTLMNKPSNRTVQQFKCFAIISYYTGLIEKIQRCLSNRNVKNRIKTVQHHWQEIR